MASPSPRYYERFSKIQVEEDMTHEFKGHRNLCLEEIPHWALMKEELGKPSRKPISRNLCGFLNTGQGGTVYCGVVDEGTVHGLFLSHYQKSHIAHSLEDLLERFSPPVPSHRYKVRFTPVIGQGVTEEKIQEVLSFSHKPEFVDPELRGKKHVLRTPEYCWCDQDSVARYKLGTLITEYVIEITILPWDPADKRNKGLSTLFNLHPIHADDKGQVYFRRQASLVKYSLQEVARMTFFEVEDRKKNIVADLKRQIAKLELSQNNKRSAALEESSSL